MSTHLRVETASGSTYEVDGATWRRTRATLASGRLRTEGGSILFVGMPIVGQPLTIVCEPIGAGSDARIIVTSPVVAILESDRRGVTREA